MNNLLSITDLPKSSIERILDLSVQYTEPTDQLKGKNIVFAFAKPSLRTKIATETAINQLGGKVIHIDPDTFYGGKVLSIESTGTPNTGREELKDTIQNVSQWCDAIFGRVFAHQTLVDIVKYSTIPVINALSDEHHPMQAITDLYTMRESFGKGKISLAFVGDSNNVAFSLAEIMLKFGHDIRIASPEKYSFDQIKQSHLIGLANAHGGEIIFTTDPREAVRDTNFIYADTFISMGEESISATKIQHFNGYQVNTELMSLANKDCHFMHCLPAHRGVEVTDDVMDGPQSLIYQQAKNRMVTARGVFLLLFGG